MGFWFEHLPESYPPLQETIDQAGIQSSNGDPREGINYLLAVIGALPPSPFKSNYSDYVRFHFAENQLSNPTITPDRKIGVFTALFVEPTLELANSIADLGKSWSLADDEGDRQVGVRLLAFAAENFEKVVTAFDERVPLEKRYAVITEDYFRVAALQDEAKDKNGAAITAKMVAPHLVALSKEPITAGQSIGLGHELQLAALYVGDRDPVMVEELIGAMPKKNAKNTRDLLEKERIAKLIHSATEDDIGALLRSFGKEPGFTFWHDLYALVKNENDTESLDRARWIVRHIDEVFPTLFKEANKRLLTMLPVEQILFFTAQDDLLAEYYRSVVAAQSVHMMSKFAGECGSNNDPRRLKAMVELVGLTTEQSKILYERYFEPVRDKNQNFNNVDD